MSGLEDWVWALPILWEKGECNLCLGCAGLGGVGGVWVWGLDHGLGWCGGVMSVCCA